MQVVVNRRYVETRSKWGTRIVWAGLLTMIVGVLLSFRTLLPADVVSATADWPPVETPLMLIGFVLSLVGLYFFNRYAKPPLPYDMLEQAMKGLDNRYHLYSYMCPVTHVLLTPSGVMAITVRRGGGIVSCLGDKWKQKKGLLERLQLVSDEPLGSPSFDLRRDVARLQKLLEEKLPAGEASKPVPISGFVYFGNPAIELTLRQATVPVLQPKTVKEYVRRQGSAARLSEAQTQAIAALLGG